MKDTISLFFVIFSICGFLSLWIYETTDIDETIAMKFGDEAQYRLGNYYYNKGISWLPDDNKPQDFYCDKAERLLGKSALKENVKAMERMVDLYLTDFCNKKDLIKAENICRTCVVFHGKEHLRRILQDLDFDIGLAYETGEGMPKDIGKAVEFYEKSIEASKRENTDAIRNLGAIHVEQKGEAFNPYKGIRLLEEAAGKDDVRAKAYLGEMYEKGIVVQKNYQKAKELYEQALDNHSGAQFALGRMYYLGTGVARDYRKAFELFRKSAEHGDANGQFALGVMYESGHGCPQDMSMALEWWRKACNGGNDSACDLLKKANR